MRRTDRGAQQERDRVLTARGRSRRLHRPSAVQPRRTGCTAGTGDHPVSTAMKSCEIPGRELEEVREKDPNGRIVVHHRTVNSLAKMLKAGTI